MSETGGALMFKIGTRTRARKYIMHPRVQMYEENAYYPPHLVK